jgi:hypothetical protein
VAIEAMVVPPDFHPRSVPEPELLARVAATLNAKHAAFRTRCSAMPAARRAHYEVELATIEITPDAHILSGDKARLALRRER